MPSAARLLLNVGGDCADGRRRRDAAIWRSATSTCTLMLPAAADILYAGPSPISDRSITAMLAFRMPSMTRSLMTGP